MKAIAIVLLLFCAGCTQANWPEWTQPKYVLIAVIQGSGVNNAGQAAATTADFNSEVACEDAERMMRSLIGMNTLSAGPTVVTSFCIPKNGWRPDRKREF